MSVPFPLPDLPRSPPSELSSLACRVLEHRDMEALTRLPDMLRDMNRDTNADAVMSAVSSVAPQSVSPGYSTQDLWANIRRAILNLLFWDIFDWQSTLRVMGERFAPTSKGAVFIGGKVVGEIREWTITNPTPSPATINTAHFPSAGLVSGTVTLTGDFDPNHSNHLASGSPPPQLTDADLHATLSHPDYEYEQTTGPRKAWDSEDVPPDNDPTWERNVHYGRSGWERFDYHECSYWMRRKPPA